MAKKIGRLLSIVFALLLSTCICLSFGGCSNTPPLESAPPFSATALSGSIEVIDNDWCNGKVTVLNYWYIDCPPCIAELHNFEEVKDEYGEQINVVAIHQGNYAQNSVINAKITQLGWSDWNITFAVDGIDVNSQSYLKFGGTGGWPYTVILTADGKISYVHSNELDKDTLVSEVNKALSR